MLRDPCHKTITKPKSGHEETAPFTLTLRYHLRRTKTRNDVA